MRRRRLLAAFGAGVASLGGCTGVVRRRSAPTATPTPSLSAFGCPPYAPEAEGVVCSHAVDADAAPVFLRPSTTEADTPASLDLTLHNDSETALTFNPYAWTVVERREEGWVRLD
ncbi:MAG: hypothetical protein ABEJ78_04630 [Haloferacaceae archaeon]